MIEYKKMSLFDAPEGSLLVHACNAQGVWGSGIAKEFAEKFTRSYTWYSLHCQEYQQNKKDLTGSFLYSNKMPKETHRIGCLFTSKDYGKKVDDPETILINTILAVRELLEFATRESSMNDWDPTEVYSNKFNSGLFNVPWKRTELVINTLLKKYPKVKWIVCDPNMEEKV